MKRLFPILIIVAILLTACTTSQSYCGKRLPEELQSESAGNRSIDTDPVTLFPYHKCLARKGNIDALYQVGLAYEVGYGVEPNINKAMEKYDQAARGFAISNISQIVSDVNLGLAPVLTGVGNDRDGHVKAQYRLGLLYLNRNEKSYDLGFAKRWLCEATRNGHVEAAKQCEKLGKSISKESHYDR